MWRRTGPRPGTPRSWRSCWPTCVPGASSYPTTGSGTSRVNTLAVDTPRNSMICWWPAAKRDRAATGHRRRAMHWPHCARCCSTAAGIGTGSSGRSSPCSPVLQSTGGSLPPPLLQNRACEATRTRLLRYPILVTDAPRPRAAVGSDLWQLRTMSPIHTLRRDRSGASGLSTAPHSDLLRAPASPSAYPGRYPRLWLLEGSLQHPHVGDPYSRGREWCWLLRS